jgi:hypothetical protein
MQQSTVTGLGVSVSVSVLLLHCLHQLQLHHYSTPTEARVLNFACKFGLPINRYVLWKPVVDPIPALSVPAGNRFLSTDEIGRRKIRFPVVIESINKPIKKQTPVCFGAHDVFGPNGWLWTKLSAGHNQIKAVP